MKQLNRNQAEELLKKHGILNSNLYQDKNNIKITFILSNNKKFLLDYSVFNQKKTYYIDA